MRFSKAEISGTRRIPGFDKKCDHAGHPTGGQF